MEQKKQVEELTPKEKIIDRFKTKKQRLSYSLLKNFKSPISLIDYKLKPYRPNAGMIFGSVCDCLLFTPTDFKTKFAIVDSEPTTDNQIPFAESLIEIGKEKELTEEIIEEEFNKVYSRGKSLVTYEGLKDYIEANIKGLTAITSEIKNEAQELIDNLLEKEDVQELVGEFSAVQKKLEWKKDGWKFIAYLDALRNEDEIVDGKFTKDADPEKFTRDIYNLKYYFQGGVYCEALKILGICENPKFTFLVYDKSGNYSIIDLDYAYIQYGKRELEHLMKELNRCVEEDAFDQSYGFFKKNYIAYKPGWAKGFLSEDFDEDL